MALDLSNTGKSWQGRKRHYVAYHEVDCSEITVPSDGTVKVFTIPDEFEVVKVRTKVVTAEGSALDIDVGDSNTVNDFGDALDGNDNTVDSFDTAGGNSAAPYTSADYIKLTFKENMTDNATQPSTCKVQVWAEMVDWGTQ